MAPGDGVRKGREGRHSGSSRKQRDHTQDTTSPLKPLPVIDIFHMVILPKVPYILPTVPPPRGQVFKYISPWGTFLTQTMHFDISL